MRRLGVLLLLVLVKSCRCSRVAYATGTVVPMPQFMESTCELLTLDPITFKVKYNSDDKILGEAVLRLHRTVFVERNIEPAHDLPVLKALRIDSSQVSTNLVVGVDEKYNISFVNGEALISSLDTWGALRGLETFSQMIFQRAGSDQYVIQGCGVRDSPVLAYRGIVVDVATPQVSPRTLLKLIDSMSYVKLNVLTLELSNDGNFAFGSERLPQLQKNRGSSGSVFSPAALEHLKEYARARGVVLGLRLNMPGGTSSWLGLKDALLTCCCSDDAASRVQLNPTLDLTYSYVAQLLGEVAAKFPGAYFDFGSSLGDFGCWANSEEVVKFMKDKGFGTDFGFLTIYFYNRVINESKALGLRLIVDSRAGFFSTKDAAVMGDVVLMAGGERWSDRDEVKQLLKKKYRIIFASCTNLTKTSMWDDPHFDTLSCFMNTLNFSPEELDLIVGGSAHLNRPTEADLLTKVWVKGFSLADLLWNFRRNVNIASARHRYRENKCRFFSRNVPARDVYVGNYCHHEFKTAESRD